jgi:hypothetical protein
MEDTKITVNEVKKSKKITKKTIGWFILVVLVLVEIGLFVYILRELSTMRRDLYAIRADFYSPVQVEQEVTDEGVVIQEEFIEQPTEPVVSVVSQEVKQLPVLDPLTSYTQENPDAQYQTKAVRVVKVAVENPENSGTNITTGQYGYVTSNGVVVSAVTVDPKADKNPNANTYFELIPGGKVEFYLYFLDTGVAVEKIVQAGLVY